MGKEGTDYSQGKVYKIVCNTTRLQYVGATCQRYLSQRLTQHVSHYDQWKKGKKHYITSGQVLEKGDYEIVLLENCPVKSVDELHARERYWIETLDCVNKVVPTRTDREYYEQNREKIKEIQRQWVDQNRERVSDYKKKWALENKDRLAENAKVYREANKDKVRENKKTYYQNNKEYFALRVKEYRLQNKDRTKEHNRNSYQKNLSKWTEKVKCECGTEVQLRSLRPHCTKQKHTEYVRSVVGSVLDGLVNSVE
jgi:hypothetical protein